MRSILRVLDGGARLIALLVALACFVAAVVGQGGRFDQVLDVPNHLEPVWLVGAVLAAIVGRRDWPTLVIAGIAGIICALQVGPELRGFPARSKPVPGAEQIKLIQFNAWDLNSDPEGTARWLLAQKADVVVIEEGFENAAPLVRRLTAAYGHRQGCGATPDVCSTLIFSNRRPVAGGPLTGTGVSAAWVTLPGARRSFTVVGAHLTHPYPPPLQREQLDHLAAAVSRFPAGRLILSGDFNSTPWSFGLRRFDRALPVTRRTRALATWPTAKVDQPGLKASFPFPLLPIDHIYAGSGWRTVKVDRGPKLGSDHRPVVVVLQATG